MQTPVPPQDRCTLTGCAGTSRMAGTVESHSAQSVSGDTVWRVDGPTGLAETNRGGPTVDQPPRVWVVQAAPTPPTAVGDGTFGHLPFVDQCHASLGRFEKPKREALAESQAKAGELLVIVEPFSVKSMASPISCMEVPGMAVGTRQELAGAV